MPAGTMIGGISYDEVGRLAQVPLRGGIHGLDLDYQYQLDDRLDAQFATVAGGTNDGERLIVNRYRYDPAGNPTSVRRITDLEGAGTSNEWECYRYDSRQRLRFVFVDGDSQCDAKDPDAPYSYSHYYVYDGKTRLKSYATREYRYNTSVADCENNSRAARPHAPSQVTAARQWDTENLTYNCIGGVEQRDVGGDSWSYDYNARGAVVRTRKNGDTPSENIYTASGQRILRKDSNGTETVYLGEQDVRKTAAGDVQVARYYAHGSRRSFGGALTHSVSNHQGSVVATMRASNGNPSQQRYHPYGNLRDGSTVNDRGFLDETLDEDQDLTYLNARHYNHNTGTFQTVDPILDPANPATLNPYTYSQGNPTKYSDASGQKRVSGNGNKDDGCPCTYPDGSVTDAHDENRKPVGNTVPEPNEFGGITAPNLVNEIENIVEWASDPTTDREDLQFWLASTPLGNLTWVLLDGAKQGSLEDLDGYVSKSDVDAAVSGENIAIMLGKISLWMGPEKRAIKDLVAIIASRMVEDTNIYEDIRVSKPGLWDRMTGGCGVGCVAGTVVTAIGAGSTAGLVCAGSFGSACGPAVVGAIGTTGVVYEATTNDDATGVELVCAFVRGPSTSKIANSIIAAPGIFTVSGGAMFSEQVSEMAFNASTTMSASGLAETAGC